MHPSSVCKGGVTSPGCLSPLTGVITHERLATSDIQPDYVCESIAELAGEPLAIPILLGLGLDEFSMNPPAIPLAKQIIRAVPLEQAQQVAEAALTLESAAAVQELVREQLPPVNLR